MTQPGISCGAFTDKRKRNGNTKEKEQDKQTNCHQSLAADRKRSAKTKVKKGQGDRSDVKR